MKILNFGSCNIDYVYSLDHIVNAGETQMTYKLETFPGGKGLNQSIALSKAGAEVYHAGCVGVDGKMLTDIMSENGVDISFMQTADVKNGHAVIQVSKGGENSIFLYPGSNNMISKQYIDSVLEKFTSGDFILLQNEINNIDYIIERAHKMGMNIVFNPSPYNETIKKIDFNVLSYIILNEVEGKCISGYDDKEMILQYLKNKYPNLKVMLTLGKNGCVYQDQTHMIYQPAFEVQAVDTTAAGDTFTGYFVAGVAKGQDIQDVLKIASAASAIAVSKKGAAPSIPQRDDVIKTINKLKTKKANEKVNELREKIETYIEQNLQSANIDELSKITVYSSVYMGNLVKTLTGETFSSRLLNKRCDVAAKMLLNTDLPIREIINRVGYNNENFFRKKFSEKYGINPLAFRKRGKDIR